MATQKDRHSDDTVVIAIRIPRESYYQLLQLIMSSPRGHDTIGGYIGWLIDTQALRRR